MLRRTTWVTRACLGAVLGLISFNVATAQDVGLAPTTAAALPAGYEGPPSPLPPAVMNRDAAGRATIRAVRLAQPLRIDGQLDEALYREVPSMSDLIQMEPEAGQPATERTEVWLTFDDDNVYVSVRCWDTTMDELVATEMRRDSTTLFQGNDIISIIFDPFYDRRNSIAFTINPVGGRSDGQIANERQYSSDWNPVWELKTGRFDGGWTVETALPFKSLRYQAGREQTWGFNLMRVKRSKNEVSALTRVPPARGQPAAQQASYTATVVGLQAPVGGHTLDLKPFVTSNVTTDRNATPRVSNDPGAQVGLDAKYSVTQNLTADFTYNTDFAQVEADEQQVNLTRFSLFFPEKREFFLENQGTFSFGGVAVNAGGGDAPILFYSRRIGLNQGRPVPLKAGGRLTGRVGAYSLGVLNIESDDERSTGARPTNFTVMRLKRDVLRKSSIGVIATHRTIGAAGTGTNQAYGVDGTFGFFENLNIATYWARTQTEGRGRDDSSYRGQLDYGGDRYAVQLERLKIGNDFDPQVGFVRRRDIVRDFAMFRFSPRPRRRDSRIRKYNYQGSLEYIANGDGRLESRERAVDVGFQFQNADQVTLNYSNSFEWLPAPFAIGGGVVLPVGGYDFDSIRLNYNMGQQRPWSANLTADYGTFYSGHKTTLTAARGRIKITNRMSAEPTYSVNRVTLPQGRFTTHLAGSRVTYTMTPLMFVSTLIQYNSGTNSVSTNARLRWEYRPGSELFVVYNEERDTRMPSFPGLSNRAFIIKANRLLRF